MAAQNKSKRRIDVEKLMQELAEVRERGYAVSSYSPGVVAIAAPVMAHDGQPVAGLSVSAPVERVTAKKKTEIIERVRNSAATMSERVSL